MKVNKYLLFLITVAFVAGLAIKPPFGKAFPISSVIAQEEPVRKPLPMRVFYENYFGLIVPDGDTTRSAFGGRLRLYDLHVAKMFEVTHWHCSKTTNNPDFWTWFYSAAGGRIKMGTFKISCQLASDISVAYGLGDAEATEIEIVDLGDARQGNSTVVFKSFDIPRLQITGRKIERWLNFAQSFKPFGFAN